MIDWTRTLASAGIGVADELILSWDEASGRTGIFNRATDWARAGGTGIGLAMQAGMFGDSRMGEMLTFSCMPLFVKSVSVPIREQFAASASPGRSRDYVPRRRNPAGSPPGTPRGSRYPAPTNQREFRNIRM